MRRLALLCLLTLTVTACDSGPSAVEADSFVLVAYEGRLEDGTVFDQSAGAQFSLQGVVPGFRNGMIGMVIGETRTFDVPPEEGYGEAGVVRDGEVIIPPNATLTFEVTLIDFR
jgi:FKBP-type peptidyl-prolyl cis-trans isomerase